MVTSRPLTQPGWIPQDQVCMQGGQEQVGENTELSPVMDLWVMRGLCKRHYGYLEGWHLGSQQSEGGGRTVRRSLYVRGTLGGWRVRHCGGECLLPPPSNGKAHCPAAAATVAPPSGLSAVLPLTTNVLELIGPLPSHHHFDCLPQPGGQGARPTRQSVRGAGAAALGAQGDSGAGRCEYGELRCKPGRDASRHALCHGRDVHFSHS